MTPTSRAAANLDRLSARQRELVDHWIPDAVPVADHSWGLVDTAVLEVASAGERYIVKTGGQANHHLVREIEAHRRWLTPWTAIGCAPELVAADDEAHVLVTRYLPGGLAMGSDAERDPDVYRQAGRLLALLHGQTSYVDSDYEATSNRKALAWLDGEHRIAPPTESRLRTLIESWPTPPAVCVPTHGDWQPRNWLIDGGVVSIIDFGRAALRPAMTDLTRLASREFKSDPALEDAFFDGYGPDPRTSGPRGQPTWHRERVREAIGTAAWAYRVGDRPFEEHGHRMIAAALRGA